MAIGLGAHDRLIDVRVTDGSQDIVIGTREGLAVRFSESEVRAMGRSAAGVRAMKLRRSDKAVGAVALRRSGTTILVATQKGFGKRSETDEYRVSHRGGKGIITVRTTEKTGKMVAIKEVVDGDDVVIVTSGGKAIRQHVSEIRVAGRNTQGVHLIRLSGDDTVADVAAVMSEEQEVTVVRSEEDVSGGPNNGQAPAAEKTGKGEKTTRGTNPKATQKRSSKDKGRKGSPAVKKQRGGTQQTRGSRTGRPSAKKGGRGKRR
jgi:DNA gyrase subunit A